jgi:hypothetical protein
MAGLTYAQQQQLIKRYLAATVKNAETAAALVTQTTARRLKQLTAQELRRFKKGPNSNGNFHKAVKLYDFPKAKGVKGPAAFVRVGIPWLSAFEDGETIAGKSGNMVIILLKTGEALGFQRVNFRKWDNVWNQIKDRAVIIPSSDGYFVGIKNPNRGEKPILLYKFQRSVTVPKKLNFYANAEKLSEGMADEIAKLIT